MILIEWNDEKNEWLKKERNISFEQIQALLDTNKLIDIIEHPNQTEYKNQRVFIVEFDNYIYQIPFVEDEVKIFLKTIIPSRKFTKRYLGEDYSL